MIVVITAAFAKKGGLGYVMPRVLPSQVVTVIDRMFAQAATQADEQGAAFNLQLNNSNQLATIVDLVEQIPEELITLDHARYAEFTAASAAIRNAIEMWAARGDVFPLRNIPGFGYLNPVSLLRRGLAQCPDEAPAPGVGGLTFIADDQLRKSLRIDVSEAYRAYADGSWKAATVLAGSALEALFLWTLEQQPAPTRAAAVAALVAARIIAREPGPNLESWVLHEYIEVAHSIGIISAQTTAQCRLTKDFRNLIHPGRAARLGIVCDRATALSALAGVEHTIRELTP